MTCPPQGHTGSGLALAPMLPVPHLALSPRSKCLRGSEPRWWWRLQRLDSKENSEAEKRRCGFEWEVGGRREGKRSGGHEAPGLGAVWVMGPQTELRNGGGRDCEGANCDSGFVHDTPQVPVGYLRNVYVEMRVELTGDPVTSIKSPHQ